MIKKIIKSICFKIFEIGKFEDMRRNSVLRTALLQQNACVHPTAVIDPGSAIYNNQQDSTRISIGEATRLMGELCVFKHGGEISIGKYCFVGPQTRIWSAKKIIIGDRVLIAHNVNIHDNISHPLNARERHLDFARFLKEGLADDIDLNEAPVIIGDDAWIGFNCVILKGVTIGKGAIVGANTLITKDVPPYAVVVGNPAKIIKYTD